MRKRIFTMLLVVLSALFLVSCAFLDKEESPDVGTVTSGEVLSLEIEMSDGAVVVTPVIEGGEGLFEYELNLADQSLSGEGRESAVIECQDAKWGELRITPYAVDTKGKRVYGKEASFVLENGRSKTFDELRFDKETLLVSTPAELILFSHLVSKGIYNNTATYTGAEGNHDEVLHATSHTVGHLADGSCVGIVGKYNGYAQTLAEHTCQRYLFFPRKVGSKFNTAGVVVAVGSSDTHGLYLLDTAHVVDKGL